MSSHSRGQASGIERLYLDFDSFFATAEQHFKPALRGRPVGAVPLDSPHTGCIAVSREAKALGVKSGATIVKARELVPDITSSWHDTMSMSGSTTVSSTSLKPACRSLMCVPSMMVVCHLLPCEAQEGAFLANRIKFALASNFSPVLTCSTGTAPTVKFVHGLR